MTNTRLLKGVLFGSWDCLVSIVIRVCDLDRAVLEQFCVAVAKDLVHGVKSGPRKVDRDLL